MKKLLWNFKVPKIRMPVISNGLIYGDSLFVSICYEKSGFYESKLLSIDLNDQSHKIILEIPHLLRDSGIIEHDKLYITSFDGNVYCIDIYTQNILWKYSTDPSRNLNPNINIRGIHLIFTEMHGQGKFTYCIDKNSGEEVWKFQSDKHVASNILIKENLVFHGSSDAFYCLDLQSGRLKWGFGKDLYSYSCAFILDDAVAVCSANGTLYILNIHSGDLLASLDTLGAIYRKPFIQGNRIYIGNENGLFACYEYQEVNKNLVKIWSFNANEIISSPAITRDQSILFGTADRVVYQLCLETGALLNKRKLKNAAVDILIHNNTLLILSDRGQVDCLEMTDLSSV